MGDFIKVHDLNISETLKKYLTRAGTGQVDKAIIEREIAKAESLVKSKIAGVYTLPLTDAEETAFIKGFAEDITIYYLWGKSTSATRPDSVTESYNDAIRELNNVRDRRQGIGLDDTEDKAAKSASISGIIR
jgi:phage gp36-like protein